MASYPPPSENLPHFNPLVFTVDETALTVGEANKIYFKKSGGIITGSVSMPSLTLNGTNVENKLTEIDVNSTKLTDISFNNNTTSILNNLSVNGILTLPNLPNVETDILSNKQKTTKITYDAGTSVTTIADTLKSSGTLIVGANNYNASDEFSKLQNVTRNSSGLEIRDNITIAGKKLRLPNYNDVEGTLTSFTEKLTNISYESGTSTTTITDTLKATGTLIVGSQNYNASNEFFKLSDVAKNGNNLTINDNLFVSSGYNFELGTITNVEQKIIDVSNGITPFISYNSVNDKLDVEKDINLSNVIIGERAYNSSNGSGIMVRTNLNPSSNTNTSGSIFEVRSSGNISRLWVGQDLTSTGFNKFMFGFIGSVGSEGDPNNYDGKLDTDGSIVCTRLDVNGDTNITGNLQLGTITDVEQKIIDVSNGITPFISYNSVNDKLEVEKNMDLSINDLTCNFMRPFGSGKYGLSQNWTQSYLEFRNGGHHIDAFHGNGTGGRDLFLNFYAEENIYLGSWFNNSTTFVNGNLNIIENTGTAPTSTGGSLTLTHNDAGGTSSIVFKSKTDNNNDYGYISYQDNYGGSTQNSLLEIGVQNDGVGSNVDNLALMPSGYVGVNKRQPDAMLDISGDMICNGNFKLGTLLDVEQTIIDISNNSSSGIPSITYNDVTQTTTFDGSFVIVPQLTITPEVPFNNATQEIYSKHSELNGVAELKLGNDIGGAIKFNNILKSENGNATFYGNDGGSETKYMEYNSIDDKINISKDMDLSMNNLDCRFMRTYFGGAKYFLSQNYNSSYLEFRNGGHQLDAFNTNGTGRSLILNSFAESDIVLGSTINNSTTIINGNLNIIENTGTIPSATGGSLTLIHNDVGGTSSIVFKSKKDPTDYGYISYKDDISGSSSGLERSLLEIGVQNDVPSIYVDNIALMPSSYVGINTRTPQSTLDVNGSVDCTEIKINSIPINSFNHFKFGTNFANPGNWGRGNRIRQPNPTLPSVSHTIRFLMQPALGTITCEHVGTYEITSTVIYRNTNTSSSTGRRNPCIGIAINNDTDDNTGTYTAPKWSLTPHDSTPFACNYARYDQGKVCTLTAKRIHHFTNDTDIVSVNTYDQANTGDDFQDLTTTYLILSATIQFKYIGNFENIIG